MIFFGSVHSSSMEMNIIYLQCTVSASNMDNDRIFLHCRSQIERNMTFFTVHKASNSKNDKLYRVAASKHYSVEASIFNSVAASKF